MNSGKYLVVVEVVSPWVGPRTTGGRDTEFGRQRQIRVKGQGTVYSYPFWFSLRCNFVCIIGPYEKRDRIKGM